MAQRKLSKKAIEQQAIAIVKDEKNRWEVSAAFITDRVSFRMRQLIRVLRKNYYGIFDDPIDQNTGLEKIWNPLTEINVEAVVKNIDLDLKDLMFVARSPEGYDITDITREAVREKLEKHGFSEKIDLFERHLAIDGTAVWKTWEENGEMRLALVDLLNVYIDPTSPSIQQAYRFTERSLLDPQVIKGMNGWMNTDGIDENVPMGLPRTDPFYTNVRNAILSNVREVDVYEMWGKIPKSLITGDRADENTEVEGHLVVSGIDTPGRERCHLIEVNNRKDAEGNSMKPYEEAWYTRVPNRWYGRGVAEKLLMLQTYGNIILNVRINRSRIAQMGLFKMKKGAGITPQSLSRLQSNGVVMVNNMDDLQQFVVQEVGQSSYKDEEVLNMLSQRLTNAFEVVTGEAMPASTPATNAAIQNQNAKSGFAMIKDSLSQFLSRWMDNHALPIIAKELQTGDIVRISASGDKYKQIAEQVALHMARQALEDSFARGYVPSPEELAAEVQNAATRFRKGDMFVKMLRGVIAKQLYSRFIVGNSEIDVNVTIQNLISMLSAAPQYSEAIVKEVFDLMGIPEPALPQAPQQAAPNGLQAPLAQPMANSQIAPQQLQALLTGANTK